MRTVVLVLADRPDHRVHPEVRGPLAEALADYAADTHAVLTGVNDVYAAHDGPSADAWQDGQGVHFAVRKDQLVGAVRGSPRTRRATPPCGPPTCARARPASPPSDRARSRARSSTRWCEPPHPPAPSTASRTTCCATAGTPPAAAGRARCSPG
ncbi:hypothetical protein ACFQ0M_44940 [Kitasatospora aburaviensis]